VAHRIRGDGGRITPPEPAVIDLHTHSSRSDGVLEPAELLAAARASGIRVLAITDHDSLAAYRKLAAGNGNGNGNGHSSRLGLDLVPAVEINSVLSGDDGLLEGELHVLGYGVDPADEAFEQLLADQRSQRRRRFDRVVERLRDLGLSVDAEIEQLTFHDEAALGRPTLARALVRAGHADSVDDAFRRILAGGRPGYVPREGVGPRAAIRAIRAGGGLPVLAHFADAPSRQGLLRGLMTIGLGGLEVYYRGFDAETVIALEATARTLRLLPTGGSDYHGDRESYAEAHAHLWVPREVGLELGTALGSEAHT
jgi:predicted metal-dependent phosphoesterase TrpH